MLTNRKYSGRRPLVVVAALLSLMILLPLAGCKNDTVPEPTRYTVKFESAHGMAPSDITVDSGTKLTAEQLKPLEDTADYIFEGWYDKDDTTQKEVAAGYTVTKDVTLVARWCDRGTVASVTFTPADGTTLYYGDTVTLATATEGATIQYKLGEGEWQDYNVETKIQVTTSTTITAKATKDGLKDSTEIKATYTLRYTVTFDTNGGSTVAPQTVESGQKATKPADPTKDGWTFQGWYEDNGLTKEFDFSTQVTADTPLYARWRANPGTVVSDGLTINGVKLASTSEVQVLSTAVDLSSPSLVVDGVNSEVFISGRSGTINPFVMGQYEVTQQLYLAVMERWGGTEPSDTYGKGDDLPAYYVSWYDAVVFCNELSQLMGLEPAYSKGGQTDTSQWGEVPISSNDDWNAITCNWDASGYRLPTEAEWELAARGGNPEAEAWKYTYAGSNTTIGDVAWYTNNSEGKTHQVGEKTANSLKLHDMSGNVWEWCWDWDGSIAAGTPPSGGASGHYRVYRGGSWYDLADDCTVSYRIGDDPYYRRSKLGFRVVRPSSK